MSKWQPIATAPKDGSSILGSFWFGRGMGAPIVIHWRKREKCWAYGGPKMGDVHIIDYGTISHWMPLPKPPEGDE